jgi:putative membrane protein
MKDRDNEVAPGWRALSGVARHRGAERKVAVYHVYFNGPGSGWWFGGLFVMVLFWGAVILLIMLAIRHFGHHHDVATPAPDRGPAAIETLKMRLARGEIDVDEYQRRVDVIKNTP